MSITFGLGELQVLENKPLDVVIGDISASNASMTAGADRNVMIDGITAIVSAQVVQLTSLLTTAAGNTGTGLMLYAHLGANTTTGILGMLSASDPLNTANNIHTAICPIAKFSFGTGANTISTISLVTS